MIRAKPRYAACEIGPIRPTAARTVPLRGTRNVARIELNRDDSCTMPPWAASGPVTGQTPPRMATAPTRSGNWCAQANAYGPPPDRAEMLKRRAPKSSATAITSGAEAANDGYAVSDD